MISPQNPRQPSSGNNCGSLKTLAISRLLRISMLSKSPFDANLTQLIFRENKKCSDETNRQSISFILHHPRCLSNESDCCGSPNQSCKASSYSSNAHLVVTSTHNIFHLQICTSFIDLQSRYSHVSYQLDKVNYIFQNVIILFNLLYSL